jgi:CBS domain-containing protein
MTKTIKELIDERYKNSSVEATRSIRNTLEFMRAGDLSAVAVLKGEQVVGVFSGRDVIRRIVLDEADVGAGIVGDVMSSPVFWISIDERYEVAKALMVEHDVRQLVVLDDAKNFCGFVTARQLLQSDLVDARELIGKLNDSYYAPRYDPYQAR